MADTFLKRSNFSGYNGSHFFLDLYYELQSANVVRFSAYIGSIDGYSGGGASTPVYINSIQVTNSQGQPGSISSIPARSNVKVGYVDVSGSGLVSATATCSTPWNGVGSASVTGSVNVGEFITSFGVSQIDETSVRYDWSTSSNANYAWYSIDNNTNWQPLPTNNIISGLGVGQGHNFYIRLRQQSTNITYDKGPVYQTTYDYPKPTSVSSGVIDGNFSVSVENPVGRTYSLDLISNNNGAVIGSYAGNINGTITGFGDPNAVANRYASIPNSQSGTYYARVTYGSSVKTLGNGTYNIRGDEKPIVTTTAIDTNKTLETNNTIQSLTNDTTNKTLIKFMSDVAVTVSASAQKSSSLKSYSTKYNNNTQTTSTISSPFTYTYQNVENATFTGSAKDSRELSNSTNASGLILVNYIKLTLENIELYRDDETSSTLKCKGNGNYFVGKFGNDGVNNSITFKIRWYDDGAWTSWQTKQMTVGSNSYSFDFTVGTTFDYTKSYKFEFEIADKCMIITDSETAKAGLPVQGLYEDFHEAFGVRTFERVNGGVKLNDDVEIETYSTNEVKTNKKWIDGKPIYRKVFDRGNSLDSFNHNISNVEHIWIENDMTVRIHSSGNHIPLNGSGIYSTQSTSCFANATQVVINNFEGTSPEQVYVVVKYTKTTD